MDLSREHGMHRLVSRDMNGGAHQNEVLCSRRLALDTNGVIA